MDGDWVEGTPQWWWKYVFPRVSERIGERMGPFPEPWRTGPQLESWRSVVGDRMGPFPEPWHTSVVSALVSAVSIKEVARRMQDEALGSELVERYDRAISELIDDFCATRWRRWPFPGPPPWVLGAVEELALLANSLQEGGMREELLGVAGRMMDRAASETAMG